MSFLIDTDLTTDFDTYTMWSSTKHNTINTEIVTKINSALDTEEGHQHSGEDSPAIDYGDYTYDEFLSLLVAGVYH